MTAIGTAQKVELHFQRLSVSNPDKYGQYQHEKVENCLVILSFLQKVLNVEADSIDNGDRNSSKNGALQGSTGETSIKLLPNVYFPNDIWLKDNIVIKDCSLKSVLMVEVFNWLESQMVKPSDDSATLQYYDKLLSAYSFHEALPKSRVASFVNGTKSLPIPDDDRETDLHSQFGAPTITSESTLNFDSHEPSLESNKLTKHRTNGTTGSAGSKRITSFSSNIISSRKRLLSLLSHSESNSPSSKSQSSTRNNSKSNGSSNGHLNYSSETLDEDTNKQLLNSLLSKSKIYNKLKKNRDSTSSINSNASNVSNYSKRTSTSTSSSSTPSETRRISNPNSLNGINAHNDTKTIIPKATTLFSSEERKENREAKSKYYLQLIKLLHLTESIMEVMNESPTNRKNNDRFLKFMDFLRQRIFTFVIIDIQQMVLEYGQLMASNMCKTL